jgi:DNA primase
MPLGDPNATLHRRYCEARGFDPDYLAEVWKVCATGPIGDYKFRLIAPIYHGDELVSYQGRDVTGKSDLRYKACPKEREVMDHHDTLYGLHLIRRDVCLVVEGITDAWRLGPGACATFGIKFRPPQVALLTRMKRVFVLYDSEVQAQAQARQLGANLAALGVDVELLTLSDGDPAEMSQGEANTLMRELGLLK